MHVISEFIENIPLYEYKQSIVCIQSRTSCFKSISIEEFLAKFDDDDED